MRSLDEGVNLDAILLDQDEEVQPDQHHHHTLEERLKEGRGSRFLLTAQ